MAPWIAREGLLALLPRYRHFSLITPAVTRVRCSGWYAYDDLACSEVSDTCFSVCIQSPARCSGALAAADFTIRPSQNAPAVYGAICASDRRLPDQIGSESLFLFDFCSDWPR